MSFACEPCQKYFNNFQDFDLHNKEHPDVKIKCPATSCNSRIKDVPNFLSHLRLHANSHLPQVAENHKKIVNQWSKIFDKNNHYSIIRTRHDTTEEKDKLDSIHFLVKRCQEKPENFDPKKRKVIEWSLAGSEANFRELQLMNLEELESVGRQTGLPVEEVRNDESPAPRINFPNLEIDLNIPEEISGRQRIGLDPIHVADLDSANEAHEEVSFIANNSPANASRGTKENPIEI